MKDYDESGTIDAATPYAAWFQLKESKSDTLQVGDLLVDEVNQIRIVKYVGFEPAEWIVPDVKLPGDVVLNSAAGVPV